LRRVVAQRTFGAEVGMAVVWSAVCALAALAAGAQQAPASEEAPQMRTKVLPGYGYIRYEVLPGDEEAPPGELIVMHEERRPAPPSDAAAEDAAPRRPARQDQAACAGSRAKLVARLFELQGLQAEPEFAEWVEKNLTLGRRSDAVTLQFVGGDPFLVNALRSDAIARGLAEDLAACERAQSR
jgi:hypothetical protein